MHHVPALIPRLFSQFVWNKDRNEKKIYLTFDDGPVPGVTDFVLDELAKRDICATFFMVGDNIQKNQHLAQEVLQSGNGVGNHTMHHVNGFKTSYDNYLMEVRACQNQIQKTLSFSSRLFRPPYGKITKKQFKSVVVDYDVIMWDVLTGDFDSSQSAEHCLKKSMKYSRNGSIVVFHDQQKTKDIIKRVLPDYLEFLKDSGLETALL
ncbi:polysaccharide deacetylase family protein [Aquiflexum sp.]|uniref:polysaccharide deacetylase family protein n=1 Tax=Aquiflexum sp. TaxID=1872584 RepID=UPI0035942FF5